MESISMSKYLEIKHPVYEALKIIPHSGIRNYNSSDIAKMVNEMYISIIKCIKRKEKKLIVETSVKCTYIIDITKTDVSFFFIVPKQYKSIAIQKIGSVWPKATIEDSVVPGLDGENITTYHLAYKNMDAFSLAVDKKSNSTLNNVLNVIDIMEQDDRISICYNLMPYKSTNWKHICQKTHEKYINGEAINNSFTLGNIGDSILTAVINTIGGFLEGLGSNISKGSPLDQLRLILGTRKREVSDLAIKKSNTQAVQTQIAIVSSSSNLDRSRQNAISTCQSFSTLDADNELVYKKSKKNINLLDYRYDGVDSMKTSVDECQNFLQLPGRELLEQHNINHVNVLETKVPDELLKGYIKLGKSTYKGNTVQTYASADKEIANLPMVFIGPMGAGKTFQNLQYANDAIAAGEGLIIIDYIKNCELAEEVRKITPKDKLIDLDLSKEENLQAFAFNEFKIQGNTVFDKIESANDHQQEIVALIDAVSIGEPLTGQMRKYLTSAADIVLIHEGMALRDVIRCLERHDIREKYVKEIPSDFLPYLEDQVQTLKELNDVDKKTGEIVGTKYSKIEHIMDRVNALRETLRLRLMYNKPVTGNIDFSKAMDDGKVILIKMPSKKFRSEHVKNVLTTFFISKIWLACNMRSEQKELKRCHVLLDEIFQAPTAYKPLRLILKQCRKFRLRLVFTAQMLGDLGELSDGLKSAGASYLLMQKSDKENFKYLEKEFGQYGFTIDDLLKLKLRHSLNLICYTNGYAAYEADLEIK